MNEHVEFADESEAIIVDEFAQVDITDATFDGIRGHAKLDDAYTQVISALRELYVNRYQHPVPDTASEMYRELASEIDLPYEQEIGDLILRKYNEQKFSAQETQKLISVVSKFVKQANLLKE